MAQDDFPHLVPLSTLQHTLHRLYPFDFLDDFDALAPAPSPPFLPWPNPPSRLTPSPLLPPR